MNKQKSTLADDFPPPVGTTAEIFTNFVPYHQGDEDRWVLLGAFSLKNTNNLATEIREIQNETGNLQVGLITALAKQYNCEIILRSTDDDALNLLAEYDDKIHNADEAETFLKKHGFFSIDLDNKLPDLDYPSGA